ncbi:nucleotidyltransferase family protein [Thauera sp.]|jgi:hypothetical protein|uniref:nucleotidyltransferase domain-containing protein n=1 Tax=Thauera sp. TaxID=1905334 RepID=UPI002A36C1A0|nr:nucleotidyltransferase family protein [Thauera sp.]MDX9885146.1 nucleotidyltransferase family protein [Thauera sp.]
MISHLDAEFALLASGLRSPLEIEEPTWDRVLRMARASGLHARLACANEDNPNVPECVQRHLLSARRIAAYRAQMVRAELFHLAPFCTPDLPVVVLKGGAYLLQQRRMARGRFAADVDLLVPADQLQTMEARLRAAGWGGAKLSPYDERYYRDWSHETPPMRFPGRNLEVDLHHALTPVTGDLAFDSSTLFERSEPIRGTPFRALCPEDQLLHACLHCFHDGDLALRVREVVDIDGLIREFTRDDRFWDKVVARAHELKLTRPLWYGLHFAGAWLDCPVPESVMNSLPAPSAPARKLMDALLPLAMLPLHLDGPPPPSVRLARKTLLARYHLMRMPMHLLIPHLARKAMLRLRGSREEKKGAPDNGAP